MAHYSEPLKVLRIFPNNRNQYTPTDNLIYCANYNLQPPILEQFPNFDEIHISCSFTWDKAFCQDLKYQLEGVTDKPVKLGGVAFGSPAEDFNQGIYIKSNIIFTSRGCNNNCPWCIVPKLEGKLRELPICQGNVIQDNNFLMTSKSHKDKVFEMLKTQKGICFKGGLECELIDNHFVQAIKGLRIAELWLACDTDADIPAFKKACEKLVKAGFNRNKIKCYVLSYGKNMDADEARARTVYEAGAMPFMQLYRDFSETKTTYSKDWNNFARMWQRPAATMAHMEKGTNYKNFRTLEVSQ